MADAATWSKRIADWRASGLTARKFCETREFTVTGLYWWSSHLRRSAALEPTAPIRLARVVRRRSSAVVVREDVKPVSTMVTESSSTSPSLMIEFAGVRVFVGGGVQRPALDVVLDALSDRARGES